MLGLKTLLPLQKENHDPRQSKSCLSSTFQLFQLPKSVIQLNPQVLSACHFPSVTFSERRSFHRPVPAQPSVTAVLPSLRFSLKTQRWRIPMLAGQGLKA